MDSSNCIEQKGVVESIKQGQAKVKITSFSACAHCQSNKACGIAESADKVIDVHVSENDFSIGEIVTIMMEKSLGLKASLIAYILPFIAVMVTMFILTSLKFSEIITGIVSLGILIPYFTGLYYFRNKLYKTFTFKIKKAG